MNSVRSCILNQRLRIFSDFLNASRKLCHCSSVRCYGVATNASPARCHRTWRVSVGTVTRPSAVRLAARSLQTSCCAARSDSVTDAELTDRRNVSTQQSADCSDYACQAAADSDSWDVEGQKLHTPVLSEEVVNLIAPVKGQVRVFLNILFC